MTATAGTWCKKDPQSTYSEDLAVYRKEFQITQQSAEGLSKKWSKKKPTHITPIHAVTNQLDYLLKHKKRASEQIKQVLGYTIQVYAGGSRDAAFRTKNKLHTHYSALNPEVKYDLPNYTVKIGKFLDKLEAYAVYAAIKKHMPQAIIRPISFANKPNFFTSKLIKGLKASAPSIPTTDEREQLDQE